MATFTTNGNTITITPKKAGSLIVKAKSVDGGFEDACTVNILQPVTGVIIDKTSHSLLPKQTIGLIASVLPANAGNKEVVWMTMNSAIATVDENGVVTGIKPGKTNIKVKSVNNSFEAICEITVLEPVESILISESNKELLIGEGVQLNATVLPENAYDKGVIWSSNNEQVATVRDGLVQSKNAGSCTITVTSSDGTIKASCEIKVVKPIPVIKISFFRVKKKSKYATITFTLNTPGKVYINILNAKGKNVATLAKGKVYNGSKTIKWNYKGTKNKKVPSGRYKIRIYARNETNKTKTIISYISVK